MSNLRVGTLSNAAGTGSPDIVGGELCRAWANIDQTGTQFARASYNISSVTDSNVGQTTLAYSVLFLSSNYTFMTLAGNAGSAAIGKIAVLGDNVALPSVANSGLIATRDIDATTGVDAARVLVSFFGDMP